MRSISKKALYVVLALAAAFVLWMIIDSAYQAWGGYKWQKQTDAFQAALSKPYREDTYGGKTPEETWGMFLDALKKEDVELASKYFVVEKQEEWKKNIANTLAEKQLDVAIEKIEKINFETSTSDTAYFNYTINSNEIPGITKNSVVFILNPYTKVWKISLL